MATEFVMPKLGLTMEEGTITAWLVPDGSEVTAGMAVMSIETDKVETEVEASASGRLHQDGAVGDTFACGAVIGRIDIAGSAPTSPAVAGDAAPAAASSADRPTPPDGGSSIGAGAPAVGGRRFVSPNARRVAADRGVDLADVTGTGPRGRIVGADVDEAAGRRQPVSPNARRIATEMGVDVDSVAGTGPGGRVVGADVERAADSLRQVSSEPAPIARPQQAPGEPLPSASTAQVPSAPVRPVTAPATAAARQLADLLGVDVGAVEPDPNDGYVTREAVARHVRARLASSGPAAPAAGGGMANPAGALPNLAQIPLGQTPTGVQRFSGMRATIAKRMHASLKQMAQLTLTMDAEMDAVVADRRRRADHGIAPGYTDYVLAAAARALRDHPGVNSQVTAEGIATLPDIHVGIAVALPAGLVVPVVHHADRLDLATLSAQTSRLADASRDGKLSLTDLEGGTFSVSALGMFGVDSFTPVINPPNAAILGVGRLRDEIALVDGRVESRRRLTLSLTWDHRVLDGVPAAAFAQRIVALLADPMALDH